MALIKEGLFSLLVFVAILLKNTKALSNSQGSDFKEFLTKAPFKDYNKLMFPRTDQTQVVEVEMDFFLVAITDFNEITATLEIIGYINLRWKTETLTWDLVRDNPTTELLLPQDTFWRPSLVLANSVESLQELGDITYKIRIDSNGNQQWNIGLVSKTSCNVDITLYPFDKQSCEIIFTTWGYRTDQVVLNTTKEGIDMSNYQPNAEWETAGTTVEKLTKDNSSYLVYTIKLDRKPGYFLVNMIIPIMILGLLNGLVFLLPYDSGERVGYAITAFLTFAVFLTMVTDNLPKASDPMSLLCYYLTLMLVLSAISTILTILILRVYHQDEDHPVPTGLRHIVSFITFRKCKKWCSKKESKNAVHDIMENAEIAAEEEAQENEDGNAPEREGEDIKDIDWKVIGGTLDGIFFIINFIATCVITGIFIVPLMM